MRGSQFAILKSSLIFWPDQISVIFFLSVSGYDKNTGRTFREGSATLYFYAHLYNRKIYRLQSTGTSEFVCLMFKDHCYVLKYLYIIVQMLFLSFDMYIWHYLFKLFICVHVYGKCIRSQIYLWINDHEWEQNHER